MKKTAFLFSALLMLGSFALVGCGTEDNDLPKSVYEGANKQRGQMQPGGGAPQTGTPGGPPPGTPGTGSGAPQGGTAQPGAAGGPPPGTPGAANYATPR